MASCTKTNGVRGGSFRGLGEAREDRVARVLCRGVGRGGVTYTLSGGSTGSAAAGLTTASSLSLLAGRSSESLHSNGSLAGGEQHRARLILTGQPISR